MTYEDQVGGPSPVHQDVRCFGSCVERRCYRSCHPGTMRDGHQAVDTAIVRVDGGLIVWALSFRGETWRAAQ